MRRAPAAALTSLATVLVLACAAASHADSSSDVRTLTVRGTVLSLSADGGRVAVASLRLGDKRGCYSGLVWAPGSGARVKLQDSSPCRYGKAFVGLTLAGSRVAWVDYDYSDHRYCAGPYQAALRAPSPVLVGAVCGSGVHGRFFDFAGDGGLLAMSPYSLCAAHCADAQGNALRAGRYGTSLWLLGPEPDQVVAPRDGVRRLWGADQQRILLYEPGQGLLLSTPLLELLLPLKINAPDWAALSGRDLVTVSGRHLALYDSRQGLLRRRLTLPLSRRLDDVGLGMLAYRVGSDLHLLRLADGRDRVYVRQPGLVSAQLEPDGLYYAYNGPPAARMGLVVFVPRGQLGA